MSIDTALQPKVLVAIINYNGVNHLRYSLPSVSALKYRNMIICVADNASTDGSLEYITENFPSIHVVRNNANLGYTGAANSAIEEATSEGAEFILILTNDVLVDDRLVKYAVDVSMGDPEIGIVGFRFFGKQRYEPVHSFQNASLGWKNLEVSPEDGIEGAAMFARVSLFQHIGLFDDAYFMYAEEEDLQIRARRAGYRSVRINVPVWHNAGDPSIRVTKRVCWLSTRSEIRFYMKHHSFVTGLRAAKTLLSRACNPFLPKEALASRHSRRSRPSNPLVNGLLVLAALCWNILFFRKTREQERIEAARIKRNIN